MGVTHLQPAHILCPLRLYFRCASPMDAKDQLQRLEARLADLRARMPAHSVRPATLMEMEDLEDEIGRLRAELRLGDNGDAQGAA